MFWLHFTVGWEFRDRQQWAGRGISLLSRCSRCYMNLRSPFRYLMQSYYSYLLQAWLVLTYLFPYMLSSYPCMQLVCAASRGHQGRLTCHTSTSTHLSILRGSLLALIGIGYRINTPGKPSFSVGDWQYRLGFFHLRLEGHEPCILWMMKSLPWLCYNWM